MALTMVRIRALIVESTIIRLSATFSRCSEVSSCLWLCVFSWVVLVFRPRTGMISRVYVITVNIMQIRRNVVIVVGALRLSVCMMVLVGPSYCRMNT